MKILIGFTILCLIGFIYLYRKAMKDAKEPPTGTHIIYPEDEEIFSEFVEDEFSPDNMISNDTIKRAALRNKLREIEEEKKTKVYYKGEVIGEFKGEIETTDLNIDYQNEEGK